EGGPGRHPGAGGCRRRRALDRRIASLAGGRLPRARRPRQGSEPGMKISRRRVGAVFLKELAEYRHNGNIVYAKAILAREFLLQPVMRVFSRPSSASVALRREHALLYMLAIPVLVPAALAAYSVVGERLQGTLEPVLTTPVPSRELLLGKAMAAFVPSVVVAY